MYQRLFLLFMLKIFGVSESLESIVNGILLRKIIITINCAGKKVQRLEEQGNVRLSRGALALNKYRIEPLFMLTFSD